MYPPGAYRARRGMLNRLTSGDQGCQCCKRMMSLFPKLAGSRGTLGRMSRTGPLILASASPRRARLLREAGYEFEQVTPPFDDSVVNMFDKLPPHDQAQELACLKAASVARDRESGVVLGCDTLLSVDDRAVGKPADEAQARRILWELMGRRHQVVTAVCLLDAATCDMRVWATAAGVTIAPLATRELEAYLASGQWRGKAGGYNLAELEGRWRFDIEGDPTTVIGLPMRRLDEELRSFAPDLRQYP